ncbi:ABC transporter ATP-binding protein [Nordella sp. HKS 07]|uniref:ABC transporter ATP-binding protein n=1 Tax=Nordella sp. HKS 07 TaxID=2712222 RepID=UPI0013E0F120|nr:ABC transporter ATP-binding protein [Nordella sp. HKS 07]QIG47073.1 ABC transporter ATP-binding protein [Nordella sp. HKS 07]
MTLLSLNRLGASLSGRLILDSVSLDVKPGEFVGLIGPNGAGKSTFLRAVMGLLPHTGEIRIDGMDGRAMKPAERARKTAYVAQDHEISWPMHVEALVALGRTPYLGRFAPLSAADQAAVDKAIRHMGIEAFLDRPASELSGGERARVLIARALAQETPVLLADEPAAGLDPAHQIAVMRLFKDLATLQGRSVIVSTHDLGLAARFCSRLILLAHGKLVADGAPEAVLTPDILRAVYGIEAHFGEAQGRLIVQPIGPARRD